MWLNKAQAVQKRAELLASGALTDEQRDFHLRQTAFLSSCENGEAESVQTALQGDTMFGTLVHAVDASGTSGLALAAKHGHVEAMEALLRFGAHAAGEAGSRPPLHWAADAGHLPACRLLLAGVQDGAHATIATSRARVDALDPFGFTARLDAARSERTEMVAFLLASGADVNAATPAGMTGLHFAAQKGCMPVAQALLAGGADASLRTEGNFTAGTLATMSSHIEMVRAEGGGLLLLRQGSSACPTSRLAPHTRTRTHAHAHQQALFLNKHVRQAAGEDALVSPGRPRAGTDGAGPRAASPAAAALAAAPLSPAPAAPAAAATAAAAAAAAPAPGRASPTAAPMPSMASILKGGGGGGGGGDA